MDSTTPDTSLLTDTVFLTELRGQMTRFAVLQLSDSHLAEDAVQEPLIGALKNAGLAYKNHALCPLVSN